jgi:acetyl-CoA carboxylase beta subunit
LPAPGLAAEDNRNGIPTRAVLLLETGGVRLQEANLGLAAIADIHAAIVDLRQYQPVIGVVAGSVGFSAACRSPPAVQLFAGHRKRASA